MGVGLFVDVAEGLCGLLGLLVDFGAKILSIVKSELGVPEKAVTGEQDRRMSISGCRLPACCFPLPIRPMNCTELSLAAGGDGVGDCESARAREFGASLEEWPLNCPR